ncbi:MAG: transketolase family protein [Candidatus Sungbacteria bacterium]|uniref:Transketolase family protein n=1 Tax=Candidatus Sungiibacteriota bacterium TaxID=2750080 RepID=A0A9D6LT99_9BACT|nr:transketolase family protein [Candidatus Sungbacteria bacterium]
MHLVQNLLDVATIEQKPTRNGYGEGLVKAGEADPNVVALCCDLTDSTRTQLFKEKFPDRFIEMGVAEQNMASVASGLAAVGKVPFIASYAMFSPGRNWEQIRTTICYNESNVKIAGAHAGVSVGPDGATHQAIEDLAITRVIPTMTVLSPCDVEEARKATIAAAKMKGPVYLRFAREKTPVFTTSETPFEIGKAQVFWDGPADNIDVAIIGCGPLVHNAILAAAKLEAEAIAVRVINNPSVKPMDVRTIIEAAKAARAVVTVEEHQMAGGMGSAVAEILAQNCPVPIEFVGVADRFGESGEPAQLLEAFGLGVSHIVNVAKQVIERGKYLKKS